MNNECAKKYAKSGASRLHGTGNMPPAMRHVDMEDCRVGEELRLHGSNEVAHPQSLQCLNYLIKDTKV